MLRSFNAEVDGLANSAEAQRYRIVQGERICGWSCDPAGPYYEQDKGLCPAQCLPGYVRPPRKRRYETIPDVCSTQPPPLPAVKGQASCSGNAASLTAAGIWMLVGVQTGPAHLGRRDGVRASWKQWENGAGVLVCFLIGRVGVTRRQLLTLDAEEKQHGDIMWLENATDAGVPTVKGFHWWRAAARLLPPPGSQRGVRIAAKVDDDSFLCAASPAARARACTRPRTFSHASAPGGTGTSASLTLTLILTPTLTSTFTLTFTLTTHHSTFTLTRHLRNLADDMQRLHCSTHLHYGSMGYTGYDPAIWKLCGWSWQPGGANYRKVLTSYYSLWLYSLYLPRCKLPQGTVRGQGCLPALPLYERCPRTALGAARPLRGHLARGRS